MASKPKNSKYALEFIHRLDGLAIKKQKEEIERLKAEVERLTLENSQYEEHHKYGQNVITSLREEVERLTKAVMHSPAAQLKLKELEGKTTFDEINPKNSNGF
jgi:predicted RNase H-like nuclease (RuvC/YqgF family)